MRQQGCNARTHDAEAVAFESLFLSLFERLLRGRDGVGFSVRDDQDDFPVLAEETICCMTHQRDSAIGVIP